MRTKLEIKQYQKEYYQKVKRLKIEQEKKEKIKETYLISIFVNNQDKNKFIVEI